MTTTAALPGRSVTLDRRREALVFALVAVSFPVVAALDPGSPEVAVQRAEAIAQFQSTVGLEVSTFADQLFGSGPGRVMANALYSAAHVPGIVAVYAWLAARRPGDYLQMRRIFVVSHVLTIACYVVLPTAPPRLVPSLGGVDPAAAGSAWHTIQYEYAAFPSGHVVFATIVGVALLRSGGAVRGTIGVAYPVTVIAVTLATDNHFVADAIGGLLIVAIAVEVSRGWARLGAARPTAVRVGRTAGPHRLIGNDSRHR